MSTINPILFLKINGAMVGTLKEIFKHLIRRSDLSSWAVNIFELYLFRVTLDTYYYIIRMKGDLYDMYICSFTGPIYIFFDFKREFFVRR